MVFLREGASSKTVSQARTSLCFFHLELYPPSYILHETFLELGKMYQVRSLHKNSLTENSRGERRLKKKKKAHKKCKSQIRVSLQPKRWLCLGYHSASYSSRKQNSTKACELNHCLLEGLAPLSMGGAYSFSDGCPFLVDAFIPIYSLLPIFLDLSREQSRTRFSPSPHQTLFKFKAPFWGKALLTYAIFTHCQLDH